MFRPLPFEPPPPPPPRPARLLAPLLQEFRPLPERLAESQHDLEHLPRLDTRQRALFGGERRIEPHDTGLEDGERQCDQCGAGADRGQRRAIATVTRDADGATFPLHRLRNRAEAHLGTVGIQPIPQPFHQGVAAVRDAELFALDFVFLVPPFRLDRQRLRTQPVRVRGVKTLQEVPQHPAT